MFEIINPLTYVNYDEMLLSTPGASFFHTSAWARVLVESYGYKPRYFAARAGDCFSALVPLMEIESFLTGKRGVSLPFSDYCDPILLNDDALLSFVNQAIGLGKRQGWKYLELRPSKALPSGILGSHVFLRHTVDIAKDENQLLSSFRGNTRTAIRKATKSGVTIAFGGNAAFMDDYYRLHSITRKKHGLPPQPLSFFRKLLEHVIESGNGQIGLAFHGQNVIAGAVFCNFGRQVVYKYCASDKNFEYTSSNNLVLWEAIRLYAATGYDSLCLGRTDIENKGLILFKRGWAAQESTIAYCKYDMKQNSYIKDKSMLSVYHNKIFSNMPIPLLNLTGSLLYRHTG